MNDEIIQTEELSGTEAEASLPAETSAPEASDGSMTEGAFYEDLTGAPNDETMAMTTEPVITVEVIESVGSDIIHANLFGSFLICGTLIGLILFRGRYGS